MTHNASTLSDWMEAYLTEVAGASIPLMDVFRAYRATLSTAEAAQWPKHRVEQEVAGSIVLVGRADQPRKMLNGYQWRHIAEQRERDAAEAAEAERLAAEQQLAEEVRIAADEAARTKARAEAARIEGERRAAREALALRVAEMELPCIERFVEFAPGESISIREMATRFERTTDDMQVAIEWYDDRYLCDGTLLDHRWTPHMICADRRLKDLWWTDDDGNTLPCHHPDNDMMYSIGDPRSKPDPIRDEFCRRQREYATRPRPPRPEAA